MATGSFTFDHELNKMVVVFPVEPERDHHFPNDSQLPHVSQAEEKAGQNAVLFSLRNHKSLDQNKNNKSK